MAEPSLGGEGFGDLLVEGEAQGRRIALLIEDKITAGPAARQAGRYARHAARMRGQGWDQVICILVAPAAYRGERARYDANLDLEALAGLLGDNTPARLDFRRGIVARALAKPKTFGVRDPDAAVLRLKTAYLDFVVRWCADAGLDLRFPALSEACYDGDSRVDPIRCDRLEPHVWLRHRCWISVRAPAGQVDLIVSPASEAERARLLAPPSAELPAGAFAATYSKGKGVQVSLRVAEMRPDPGFDPAIGLAACEAMRRLAAWRLGTGAA